MDERLYWSSRVGRGQRANPSIEDLARALTLAVEERAQRDFLQGWYGYHGIDAGSVEGKAREIVALNEETSVSANNSRSAPEIGAGT